MQPSRRAESAVTLVWLVLAAGAIARLALAFASVGQSYDIGGYRIVADALATDPLHVYSAVETSWGSRWPYPPGYFPFVLLADALSDLSRLPFHGWVQVPAIAADTAIAWVVQDELGRRGRSRRARLGATALVALGPSFIVISGYHGQIDSLAILPALLGFLMWNRGARHRALAAGLSIGVGGAIKPPILLVLLALLPSVHSRREAVTLIGTASAVPLALLAPFLLSDSGAVLHDLDYAGVPGVGGLSLAVQPELGLFWLSNSASDLNGPTEWLRAHGLAVDVVVVAGLGALLAWKRPDPIRAVVLLWLAVYALGTVYLPQYMVWGLPFFIVAGYLRAAAWLQGALLLPTLLFYLGPFENHRVAWLYVAMMIGIWLGLLLAATRSVMAIAGHPRERPGARAA